MGILQSIRAKLGVSPEMPDSAALTQALGEKLQEVNRIDADILALERRLPLDVIQNPDGGEASSRELADLKSKHDRLTATCDALRRENAEALARERAAELAARWNTAEERSGTVIAAAGKVDAIIESLADAIVELREAVVTFDSSLPTRAADYGSSLQSSAASFASAKLRAIVTREPVTSLHTIAENDVAVALRARLLTKEPKQSGEKAA